MSDITGGKNDTQSILVTTQQRAASSEQSTQKATIDILPQATQERIKARIEKAQAAQQDPKTPTKISIKGEVIGHDPDDTSRYTVRTEDGEITLRTKNARQERPPVGQQVHIDLPPTQQNTTPQHQAEVYIRPRTTAPPPHANAETRISATPVELNIPPPETVSPRATETLTTALRSITAYLQPIPAETPVIPFEDSRAPYTAPPVQTTTISPLPLQASSAAPIIHRDTPAQQNTLTAPQTLAAPPIIQTTIESLTTPTQNHIPALPAALAQFTAQPLLLLTQMQSATPVYITAPQIKSPSDTHTTTLTVQHPQNTAITTSPFKTTASHAAHKITTTPSQPQAAPTVLSLTTPQTTQTATITLPQHSLIFSAHPQTDNSFSAPNPLLSSPRAESQTATWLGFTADITTDKTDGEKQAPLPVVRINMPSDNVAQYRSIYTSNAPQDAPQNNLFLLHSPLPNGTSSGAIMNITPQTLGNSAQTNNEVTIPDIPKNASALPILGPILFNTQPWDTLNTLHQALQQTAPQGAAMLASTAPSTSNLAQMMPAALFFISAIKGGDINNWMSETTLEALKKAGKAKALGQFGKETNALSRLASEPASEWRTHALPLYHDGSFHKILLHARQDTAPDEHDNKQDKLTRFIFDLSLNNIGPVQLDGLFKSNRLDVILRTEQHFTQSMQAHMRRLYKGALEQTKINGDLSFQNRADSWVTIQEDTSKTLTQNA